MDASNETLTTFRRAHKLDRESFLSSSRFGIASGSLLLLELDGRSVADLTIVDLRHPALVLVLPLPPYSDVELAFTTLGDQLWNSKFRGSGTALRTLEHRASALLSRSSICTAAGEPLAGVSIDLFDSTLDRPSCPFALLDLRSAPALVFAKLRPIQRGPVSRSIELPPSAA